MPPPPAGTSGSRSKSSSRAARRAPPTARKDRSASRSPAPPLRASADGARLVPIGEIVGVHGVRGELRMRAFNRDSEAVADRRNVHLVDAAGEPRSFTIERARAHGAVWLLSLEGVGAPETARALVGRGVAIPEDELPELGSGEFYAYRLVGLDVIDEAGVSLGRVSEVLSASGNDVLVVRDGARERMFPLVDRVVRDVDVAAGRIVVAADGALD